MSENYEDKENIEAACGPQYSTSRHLPLKEITINPVENSNIIDKSAKLISVGSSESPGMTIQSLRQTLRTKDGIIMKLTGQAEKRKKELEDSRLASQSKFDQLKLVIKEKEQLVALLESQITELKSQIRGSSGQNTLLKYRLQKTIESLKSAKKESFQAIEAIQEEEKQVTETQNEYENIHQAWLIHINKFKSCLSNITRSNQSASVESLIPVHQGLSEPSTNTPIDSDVEDKLKVQMRLNERLVNQLHAWVDNQIDLHRYLAEHEVKSKIFPNKKQVLPNENSSEYSLQDIDTARETPVSVINAVPIDLPVIPPVLINQTTTRIINDAISDQSAKSPSPFDLKKLFSGLENVNPSSSKQSAFKSYSGSTPKMQSIQLKSPYITSEKLSPLSVYSIDTNQPKLRCGGISLSYQDIDSVSSPGVKQSARASRLVDQRKKPSQDKESKQRSIVFSPETASICSSLMSPTSFEANISKTRRENSFIRENVQRFQSTLQKYKSDSFSKGVAVSSCVV